MRVYFSKKNSVLNVVLLNHITHSVFEAIGQLSVQEEGSSVLIAIHPLHLVGVALK